LVSISVQKRQVYEVKNAHDQYLRDIELIKNNPYCIISSGDDCKIKMWDIRNLSKPKIIDGHSHWIWNVQINQFFDSLLLSSSTDGSVNLWNVGSLTYNKDDDINQIGETPHRLVKVFDTPESVYGITWSECEDDWRIFASLSYDGRVVFNQVTDEEVNIVLTR